MKISEVASLTGITVRTLHYYDEVGLLVPTKTTENGYRVYTKEDLEKLQNILFFREMDFSLNDIKDIINNPSFDREKSLKNHKMLLEKKRDRLNDLISLVDKTLNGDDYMSFKEFDNSDIEKIKDQYAKEAKDKYGDSDAYKESEKKTKNYNKNDWQKINEGCNDIFKRFATSRDKSPENVEVQKLVSEWQQFISNNFYNCTNEILAGLGELYVNDQRFQTNIDKNGEGTAKFISQAIKVYCSSNMV